MDKCPGGTQDGISVGLYKCAHCGHEVEIFSDEIKAKCPKCGNIIYRDKIPSCIDWCAGAKKCIGSAKWEEIQRDKKKLGRK